MLKIVNQYWQFATEEELNKFLNVCIDDSNNEYHIERYGKSQKGVFYAFGSVIPTAKFSTKETMANEKTSVKDELNLG